MGINPHPIRPKNTPRKIPYLTPTPHIPHKRSINNRNSSTQHVLSPKHITENQSTLTSFVPIKIHSSNTPTDQKSLIIRRFKPRNHLANYVTLITTKKSSIIQISD